MPCATASDVLIPGLMEHVERAGVHSGDSVAVFPPQHLSQSDQDMIVDAMTRIALAIGVKGLVNAQFIIRDDGVYLLEVNPRASRTVPFLSKVTGVPMVSLATRVALGARLADLGWSGGLRTPPPVVAVKAPVFSTTKLRGVDPLLGPGMRSTGEVIGLHTDPGVALAKALLAASLRPPVPGPEGAVALVSIADRDKEQLPELAAALAHVGYRFAATAGTAAQLRALGHEVLEVTPLGDESTGLPHILDVIGSGDVSLVVNTPAPRSGPVRDAAAIRHAAVAEGILCLTSMDTAMAAARSLDPPGPGAHHGHPVDRPVGGRDRPGAARGGLTRGGMGRGPSSGHHPRRRGQRSSSAIASRSTRQPGIGRHGAHGPAAPPCAARAEGDRGHDGAAGRGVARRGPRCAAGRHRRGSPGGRQRTPAGHDAQLGRGRPERDGRTVPARCDGWCRPARSRPSRARPAARPAEARSGVVAQPRGGGRPGAARGTGRRLASTVRARKRGRGRERAAWWPPSVPPAATTDVQRAVARAPLCRHRLEAGERRRARRGPRSPARGAAVTGRPVGERRHGRRQLHHGVFQPAAVRGVPVVGEVAARVGARCRSSHRCRSRTGRRARGPDRRSSS